MDFEAYQARVLERGESAISSSQSGLCEPARGLEYSSQGREREPKRCVIALRSDLPPEHQIIQAAHAAYEAGALFGLPGEGPLHLALLEAKDEADLMRLAGAAEADGIELALFFEPDGDTGATAFATQPIHKGQSRSLRKAKKWPGRRLGS